MKFKKKPVIIDAVLWTGLNHRETHDFLEGPTDNYMETRGKNFLIDHTRGVGGLVIRTLEGECFATEGDWIIKGTNGEYYPCKPDIFGKIYEPID